MFYRRVYGLPQFGFSGPFSQLDALKTQMDRLTKAFDSDFTQRLPAGVFPLITLREDSQNYYINAELPGVKSDDLDIQADAKSLSISGERKIEAECNGVKYHRKEREAGKFSRMIGLPGEIDANKIEANLKDGILAIVIPKSEAVKPRKIAIK